MQSVTRKIGRSVVFDESLLATKVATHVQRIGRYVPRGKQSQLQLYSLTDLAVKLEMSYDDLKARIRDLAR